MQAFWRSIRYLWPYRTRLGLSILCAVLIAVLWGGGFTLVAPGIKVLLTEDGLHGWAWQMVVQDRLDVRLVARPVPAGVMVDGRPIGSTLDLVAVEEGGLSDGKLAKGQWIVGIVDSDPAHALMSADETARMLSEWPAKKPVTLRVLDFYGKTGPGTVELTPEQPGLAARVLADIVGRIPPPEGDGRGIGLGRFHILLGLMAIAMAMTVVRNGFRFFNDYLVQTACFKAEIDIRRANYGIALRLPLTYFSRYGTSDTMTRFIADAGELRAGHTALFGKTMVEPARAIACFVFAMVVSWKLTVATLVVGPIVYLFVRFLAKRVKRASKRALEGWSRLMAKLEETLTGIRVVKAYTSESREEDRFTDINAGIYKQQRRMARIDSCSSPVIEVIGATAGLAAASVAAYWVLVTRTMTAETLGAWVALLAGMFDPIRKLSKVITRFHRADAAATRIFELHDAEQEKNLPDAPDLPRHRRSLAMENVAFRYPDADTQALVDVSFEIEAGHSVAFVGPNGSGKTTLVSMVPRLLDPDSGRVLIDGQDVARVDLYSLRSQISVVTQDSVLFNATIAENIAYGSPEATREQIEAAGRKAFVHEFVAEMPDGYDTMVAEHGTSLSGGQKQRITIARAILRDPAILIFDEAMSQVDSESERRIHEAMEEVIRDRTTLIVAHRFATVLSADRIVVLDAGRIVDAGRHEELLGRCRLYQQLYETQFVDMQG